MDSEQTLEANAARAKHPPRGAQRADRPARRPPAPGARFVGESARGLPSCNWGVGYLGVVSYVGIIRGGRWGEREFDHLCESREREMCSSGLLPEGKHDGLTCSSPGREEERECQEVVVCLCVRERESERASESREQGVESRE
jgi:hypothetical protein